MLKIANVINIISPCFSIGVVRFRFQKDMMLERMGLNYPIILRTRFSPGEKIRQPLRVGERWASLVRLDGDPGIRVWRRGWIGGGRVGGRGWLRMRDGRSKTAPIINHRMIHSIVPSPRTSVPSFLLKTRSRRESSSFLERDHLCCRERACLVLAKEAIYHPWNPVVPATHLTSTISRSLFLSVSRLRTNPSHLPRRKPSHTSTYTPEPATAFILVRSFLLFSTPLQIAPISRVVNFIFPRHPPSPPLPQYRIVSLPRGLSILEKL